MAATFTGVKPELALRGQGIIRESEGTIVLSEGFRHRWEQEIFYDLYLNHGGALAARPGTSEHEFGLAVDLKILVTSAYDLRARLAKRWGLWANVRGEAWHFVLDPKRKAMPAEYPIMKPAEVPVLQKEKALFLPEDHVGSLPTPAQDGAWILKRNGGIETTGNAPFYGSYWNTPKDERPTETPEFEIGGIHPWNGGYVCVMTNGSLWHYNAEVSADLKRRGLA